MDLPPELTSYPDAPLHCHVCLRKRPINAEWPDAVPEGWQLDVRPDELPFPSLCILCPEHLIRR